MEKSKRGGYRPGAGRKAKPKAPPVPKPERKMPDEATVDDVAALARTYTAVAVETLAAIAMSDAAPPASRVSAANALLDRGHGKAAGSEGYQGKKEQRQAQAETAASAGKFAVPSGPRLAVNNTR